MNASEQTAIRGRITRLRVFSIMKRELGEGRQPNGVEIARELGVSSTTVQRHMRALFGAEGLTDLLPQGTRTRTLASDDSRHQTGGSKAAALSHIARGVMFDENTIPVDELFALEGF